MAARPLRVHLWARSVVVLALLGIAPVASGGAGGGEQTTPASAYLSSATGTDAATSVGSSGISTTDFDIPAVQDVVPGVVLAPRHRKVKPQRTDAQWLHAVSATGDHDVPEAALRAYQHAAGVLASSDPACRLPWTLLAAIGRVESNHGRFGGSVLGSDGVSRPAIRGPQLNGAGPFAAIPDTDGGVLDGDPVWDRAVGAMQFLPGTWRSMASDGDGNGRTDPNDIDDAALGSARYLCAGSGSVAEPAGMAEALYRYNPSDYYVLLVMSFEQGYRTGVFSIPSPPAEEGRAQAGPRPRAKASGNRSGRPRTSTGTTTGTSGTPRPGATSSSSTPSAPAGTTGTAGGSGSTPTPSPSPRPTPRPTPKPSPTPTPTPSPGPVLVEVTGVWQACDGGWCLGGTRLDLGDQARLDAHSAEFSALAGTQVALQVESGTDPARVFTIAGTPYRLADGSFAD